MSAFSRRQFLYGAGLVAAMPKFKRIEWLDKHGHRPWKPAKRFHPKSRGNPYEAPVGDPLISNAATGAVSGSASSSAVLGGANTLVLYDTTNEFGWLGELYGIMAANLASHFGSWTAQPVVNYVAGQMNQYTAVIYIGSTYDEPLPVAFLDDVLAGTKPIIWVYDNIWQLTNRWAARNPGGDFAATYGWMWSGFDFSTVGEVRYKSTSLRRYEPNAAGIMNYSVANSAAVLATAVRSDGTTFPWAVRSRTLTYFGENPFVFMVEGDRVLAFEDLLFDALAPATVERHRALVRLEDLDPTSDPAALRAVADYLFSKRVPFSFGVISHYMDPTGADNGGVPRNIPLKKAPKFVSALKYLQQRGGVMIEHGWTHQYSNVSNPYNAVSGDDFEFYRVTENPDHTLNFVGPLPEDSTTFALSRVSGAAQEFRSVGLAAPAIFEFPHYTASATDYKAIAMAFATRYERALYFRGLLSGGPIDSTRLAGQRFSFVVRDVYGTKVIPENLGSVEPEPFFIFPTRFPADILGDAQRVRVVRDGFASFYFHPFLSLSYLKDIVEGLLASDWTFVSPTSL